MKVYVPKLTEEEINMIMNICIAIYILSGLLLYYGTDYVKAWRDLEIRDILTFRGLSYVLFSVAVFGMWIYFSLYLTKIYTGTTVLNIMFASLFVWIAMIGKDSALFRNR